MTDPAAIQGNYADFKLVKTRNVAQLVIEIPIERAKQAIDVFGIPQPSAEIAVAVARLNVTQQKDSAVAAPEPSREPKERKPATTRAEEARRMCSVTTFQQFLGCVDYESASEVVKRDCGVQSKALLDTDTYAAQAWDALLTSYEQKYGRMAERHG